MKMRPARNVCGLLLCTMLAGCFCSRYRRYTVVSVDDIGERISTRHRYRVAEIDQIPGIGGASRAWLDDGNVFSEDGIPVVLRVMTTGGSYKYGWTEVLAGFSVTLFPALKHTAQEQRVEIVMVDDSAVGGEFTVTSANEYADGIFPTALIPFAGEPGHGNCRVYWRSGCAVGTEEMLRKAHAAFADSCPDFERLGFAYSVAAKLKAMEDDGAIDAMLARLEKARSAVPKHRIVKLAREPGRDFLYAFSVELDERPAGANAAVAAILREVGEQLKEEYADTYPGTAVSSLVVDFADVANDGKLISGRAAVLSMKPVSLAYDAAARRGTIAVRFGDGQYEAARAWARKNIETLARDKNVTLATGQLPPPGEYRSLGERQNGNILEIDFKTE